MEILHRLGVSFFGKVCYNDSEAALLMASDYALHIQQLLLFDVVR